MLSEMAINDAVAYCRSVRHRQEGVTERSTYKQRSALGRALLFAEDWKKGKTSV